MGLSGISANVTCNEYIFYIYSAYQWNQEKKYTTKYDDFIVLVLIISE